jgi:NADPH:quinone reductase
MKAVRIEEFGGPEVLRTADVPMPEPGEDEVLIELRASGVNRADVLTRGGGYHAAGQPPIVPGFEGNGVVREVGPAVTGISVGDRVLAFGGRPGFYAEYVAVPHGHVVSLPETLDWTPLRPYPSLPSRPGTACGTSPGFEWARRCSFEQRQVASVMRRFR